jgi:hypothetical protein
MIIFVIFFAEHKLAVSDTVVYCAPSKVSPRVRMVKSGFHGTEQQNLYHFEVWAFQLFNTLLVPTAKKIGGYQ